jgi:hypothetical protein
VLVPTGSVHQEQLNEAVLEAAKALDAKEVRHIKFSISSNANGEPSIFFGILLTA